MVVTLSEAKGLFQRLRCFASLSMTPLIPHSQFGSCGAAGPGPNPKRKGWSGTSAHRFSFGAPGSGSHDFVFRLCSSAGPGSVR